MKKNILPSYLSTPVGRNLRSSSGKVLFKVSQLHKYLKQMNHQNKLSKGKPPRSWPLLFRLGAKSQRFVRKKHERNVAKYPSVFGFCDYIPDIAYIYVSIAPIPSSYLVDLWCPCCVPPNGASARIFKALRSIRGGVSCISAACPSIHHWLVRLMHETFCN